MSVHTVVLLNISYVIFETIFNGRGTVFGGLNRKFHSLAC